MFYTSQYDQPLACEVNDNDAPRRLVRSATAKPNKQLPEKAIRLMNAWYLAHEDNPYPNRNDLDYLATNGGIKESQVKAWFSNKRNRTQNTHPKRAKRYLTRNQTPGASYEPEKIHIADELEQRAQAFQHSHEPLPPSVSPVCSAWSWLPTPTYDYCSHPHSYYAQ